MSRNIDTEITDLIASFTARLWTANNTAFYGRIFRSQTDNNTIVKIQPLYYSSTVDSNPVEVLKNDTEDAQLFIDVLDNATISGASTYKYTLRCMFAVNLIKLYPTYSRTAAIEQVKKEVLNILTCHFNEVFGFVSGYTAFSDYQWTEASLADMKQNYLFRYDCNTYLENC